LRKIRKKRILEKINTKVIKMTNLKAVQNKVILSVLKGDKITSTGIVLQYSVEPDYGVVESIGPDVREVNVGDTVFLDWNTAEKIPEEELWVTREDNIIFIKE
jgi:co-chaperonin GroES (HSP10)